ncbi:hypothetical protein R1sor_017428 [Riccia sorocarpa]|uniref:Uncharacterized protein n=1 Tax=Riccia sorocarpa TaxID=122646 RepID=A0ABD3I7Y1_9MARC
MDGVGVSRARESLDVVHAMATLLNAKLDRTTLSILIALCDHGVNPEALAVVVKEMLSHQRYCKIIQITDCVRADYISILLIVDQDQDVTYVSQFNTRFFEQKSFRFTVTYIKKSAQFASSIPLHEIWLLVSLPERHPLVERGEQLQFSNSREPDCVDKVPPLRPPPQPGKTSAKLLYCICMMRRLELGVPSPSWTIAGSEDCPVLELHFS